MLESGVMPIEEQPSQPVADSCLPLMHAGPWSDACEAYAERARRDAIEIVQPLVQDALRDNLYPRRAIVELARRGHLRERWCKGGPRGDVGRAILLLYEVAYATDVGVALGLSLHMEAVTSILAKARPKPGGVDVFEQALEGEFVGCIAMTEPHTGSDYLNLKTRAHRDAGGWRLNGRKKFISLAMTADMGLVFATTGDDMGDVSVFLVPRGGDSGYHVVKKLEKLGTHSIETCVIDLEDAWVPEDHLVGRLHRGVATFSIGLTCERLGAVAIALGALRSSIEIARTYLHRRKTRTGVLWDNQALRHSIADLVAQHDVLWRATKYTAWGFQNGLCDERDAASVKVVAAPAVERALSQVLQLLGGAGYTDEFPVERRLRDVRLARIGAGTDEILRNVVAGKALGDDAYERWVRHRGSPDGVDES